VNAVTRSSVPEGSVPGISSAPNRTVIAINTARYALEPKGRSGPGESDVLRGHEVLLDAELAALYGVSTKRLNELAPCSVKA